MPVIIFKQNIWIYFEGPTYARMMVATAAVTVQAFEPISSLSDRGFREFVLQLQLFEQHGFVTNIRFESTEHTRVVSADILVKFPLTLLPPAMLLTPLQQYSIRDWSGALALVVKSVRRTSRVCIPGCYRSTTPGGKDYLGSSLAAHPLDPQSRHIDHVEGRGCSHIFDCTISALGPASSRAERLASLSVERVSDVNTVKTWYPLIWQRLFVDQTIWPQVTISSVSCFLLI